MTDYLGDVGNAVLTTIAHTWPFLVVSILAAAALTTFVGTERIEALMRRRLWIGIAGAVALATLTPFCSCGTTAVLLGGLASSAPWAPIVAFLVSSPLTSPSELVFSVGLFGWPFALTFFGGTIVIGIAAGGVTAAVERTGWLRGQARMATASCSAGCTTVPAGIGPGTAAVAEYEAPPRARRFRDEVWSMTRRVGGFFLAFTTVAYLFIEAIPTDWMTRYVGGDSLFAVPLAALAGIPTYLNTEASLPLVAGLMDGGMGPGPALALIVTGAGTSVGAMSGLLMIARSRVVALVVAILFVSALALGWVGQVLL